MTGHLDAETTSLLCKWTDENEYVRELWLFGSFAKGKATVASDIDLALRVRGDHARTALGVCLSHREDWQAELESLTGRSVDLEPLDYGESAIVGPAVAEHGILIWSNLQARSVTA